MGKFTFTQTEIPGVVVIEPQVFGDDRGYFMETYQKDQFAEAGIDKEFVQDNQSRSTRGVLRGLHFQKNHTQGKLVRVTKGEVYDVAVDCRPHSATFGKWVGVTLSEDNKKMFYIPEGFAHGFLVLLGACKLTSLIRVQNQGFCHLESFFQRVYDHSGVQGIIYLPANNTMAIPVNDGCQIQEAVLDGDIGDVD